MAKLNQQEVKLTLTFTQGLPAQQKGYVAEFLNQLQRANQQETCCPLEVAFFSEMVGQEGERIYQMRLTTDQVAERVRKMIDVARKQE